MAVTIVYAKVTKIISTACRRIWQQPPLHTTPFQTPLRSRHHCVKKLGTHVFCTFRAHFTSKALDGCTNLWKLFCRICNELTLPSTSGIDLILIGKVTYSCMLLKLLYLIQRWVFLNCMLLLLTFSQHFSRDQSLLTFHHYDYN